MAVAFRSVASTSYASRTNTTVSAPAGIANDDILLATIFVGSGSSTVPSVTPPTGFTLLQEPTNSTNDGSFYGKLRIYWKRAASESGSYTFTHSAASSQCAMLAISGAIASGSPIDVFSFQAINIGSSIGGQTVAPSVTTTVANTLLAFLVHDWTASTTLSPPTSFTEHSDSLVYTASKVQSATGATGSVEHNNGNPGGAGPWSAYLVAVKPTATAGITVNATGNSATVSTNAPLVPLPTTIAVRSVASTGYAGAQTNTTVSAPSGLADNDILLAGLFLGHASTVPTPTPPSGFTALTGSPLSMNQGATFLGKLHVWWKRAASESGSYVFTHTSASRQAVLLAIKNAKTSGTPIDVSSTNWATDGNVATATSITTTAAGDLLVYLANDWEGTGTISPPANFTEQFDGLVYAATSYQVLAGATGNVVQTNGNNLTGDPWGAWLIGVFEAPVTGGGVTVTIASVPAMTASTQDVGVTAITNVSVTLASVPAATISTSTPTVSVGGSVSVNATTNFATISTSTPGVNFAFKVNAATNFATISTSTPTVTLPGAFPVVQTATVGGYTNKIDTTFSAPSGLADNDVMIVSLFAFHTTASPTVTPPTGWTEISGSPLNVNDVSANNAKFHVYWKRAASESGSYTFSHTTSTTQGGILTIRGAKASGSPIDVQSVNSANAGNVSSVSSITPTSDNTMLVWTGFDWTGSGTLTAPSGFTERWDTVIYAATKTPVTAAATGTVTMNNGNPPTGNPWGMFLLGIAPATTSTGNVTVNATTNFCTAQTGGAVGSIPLSVIAATNFCTISTSTPAVAFPKTVDAATNFATISTTTPIVSLPMVVNAATNFCTALTQDVTTKQGATATIVSVPQISIGTTIPDVAAGGGISVGQTSNFVTISTSTPLVSIVQNISTTLSAVPGMAISTFTPTVSGKAIVSPTSPQMLASTKTPIVNTTFALAVLLEGNFASAQTGGVTVPIIVAGGFDLNPALSYSVHASLQSASTTTTATINTGTLPFAYPNPFEFQDWSSSDTVVWAFGQSMTAYTGGTRADAGIVSIMVTSPQMTMSLGATFVTGVAQPRPPEKEGRMLALTNMMGS